MKYQEVREKPETLTNGCCCMLASHTTLDDGTVVVPATYSETCDTEIRNISILDWDLKKNTLTLRNTAGVVLKTLKVKNENQQVGQGSQ